MEYLAQFHWWYSILGILLIFLLFGKNRGGIVSKLLIANMEILDKQFEGCQIKAKYSIFKKDSPNHIKIELKELSIPVGEELELLLNGSLLSKIKVERDKEAEFDYWSDEGVRFPLVNEGDELVITYINTPVFKGIFKLG